MISGLKIAHPSSSLLTEGGVIESDGSEDEGFSVGNDFLMSANRFSYIVFL